MPQPLTLLKKEQAVLRGNSYTYLTLDICEGLLGCQRI